MKALDNIDARTARGIVSALSAASTTFFVAAFAALIYGIESGG